MAWQLWCIQFNFIFWWFLHKISTLLCCFNSLLEENNEKQTTILADIGAVWRKDTWTEERTLDVTYPGCTGTQRSVHISRPLPRDSQIISLPWHGTSSTAPGCLTEHDTASACVHVAERPGLPAISASCRMQNLRAMLAACFVNRLHVFEKTPCKFRGGCRVLWVCHSVQICLACVLSNLIQMQEAVRPI